MASVAPFRGLLYNSARVPDLGRVVAAPGAPIPPDEPLSVALLLNPAGGQAGDAAALMRRWRHEGVLELDARPCFYIVSQAWRERGMPERTRWGVLARIPLSPDRAPAGPGPGLSPATALYSDPSGDAERLLESAARRPADRWMSAPDGTDTRIWRTADPVFARTFAGAMEPLAAWVAEGDERLAAGRTPDGDRLLAFLTRLESPALGILPYHRVLRGSRRFNARSLAGRAAAHFDVKHFSLESYDHRGEQIRRKLRESASRGRIASALYAGGDEFFLYLLKEEAEADELLGGIPEPLRRLDAAVLDKGLLEAELGLPQGEDHGPAAIRHTADAGRALGWVDAGEAQAAFLLNPPSREQIAAVAAAGLRLPDRSACFLPQFPAGLVLDPFEPAEERPAGAGAGEAG
ncbi:MAG TPA: DUF1015 family protein [Candidatus Polarisedimenticolia bacterium]|nr:DUF1015 family protein [Candidatus Polarisedimenticolia bacterium]